MSENQDTIVAPRPERSPAEPPPDRSLSAWRDQLLNRMLYAAAIVGLPAVIAGSITALRDAQPTRIVIFAAAYLLILVMTFGRRLVPYSVRGVLLLTIAMGLGLDSLGSTGLPGSGRIFLIAMTVMATLLFGTRGGWMTLVIGVVSTVAVAFGMASGFLPFSASIMSSSDPASWITGGVVFTLLGVMLILSLGTLQRGLETALTHESDMVRELKEHQSALEASVSERTSELLRQSLQLQAAAEIAKLSAESSDLDKLLTEAAQLIKDRFDFYHASVFLVDESGAWAEIAASTGAAGRALIDRRHKLAIGSASIVGWVTANRMPRVSPNVSDDPFYFRNPALPDTRSEMAVPLMIGQRLIGALDVQSTDLDAFGEGDIRVVEAIAGDLAFAIDHARLSQEQQAQLFELEGDVQDRVRQSWNKFARSGTSSVIHLGPSGDSGATSGPFTGLAKASRQGQTVISDDGREVVVPVRVRGETIAAIGARKSGEGEIWSDEDVALIEAVAGQAALAMETARQYAEEQRRVAELEVVNRVSQAASQLLRVDSLLKVVGRQIIQVMGQTDVQIAVFDEATNTVKFSYATEMGEPADLPDLPLGQGLVSHVIRTQQPLLLEDALQKQAAELGVQLDDPELKSWLGVPLLAGNQTIGVLVTQDKTREHRFTEDDVALLSTVAGQVATALQNARLLEQVQQSARRERLIHEITSKVRRSPDIQTVLETTAREVGRALNVARATIRLGEAPPEHLPPDAQPPEVEADGS
jgi:GAF domain-containing protein